MFVSGVRAAVRSRALCDPGRRWVKSPGLGVGGMGRVEGHGEGARGSAAQRRHPSRHPREKYRNIHEDDRNDAGDEEGHTHHRRAALMIKSG